MTLTVAIVGRPNVGKSTLFNRLTGTKHALVDDRPGVTRDWRMGDGRIGPMHFRVLDTAGLEEAGKETLEGRMFQQTERALEIADIALLLVDARSGITPQDHSFAKLLRRRGKPVILAVNKAEGQQAVPAVMDAYALGLGEAVPISAEHGEGMADLYGALEPHIPVEDEDKARKKPPATTQELEDESMAEDAASRVPMQIAIIGRPNAGKSTLLNKLLGEERVLTGPEAGITRDAIAVDYHYAGRDLKLIDTAGIRRKANVQEKLEKLAVGDALRTIRFAHVVVVLLDAMVALEKQDLQLVSLVEREGRALVIGINKWDLIAPEDRQEYLKVTESRLAAVLPQVKGVPIVPLCAEKGQHVDALIKAAFKAYDLWNTRISTGALNRWLEEALMRHTPPLIKGKRLKVRYITQIKTRPPTFALFVNMTTEFPDHYLRYLINGLRDYFGVDGVPVRFSLRKGKNPYAEDRDA